MNILKGFIKGLSSGLLVLSSISSLLIYAQIGMIRPAIIGSILNLIVLISIWIKMD